MRAVRRTALKNGEMAERSNAAVLKTVDGQLSGGSNPSLSAIVPLWVFTRNGTISWRGMRGLRGGKKTCFRKSAGSTADLTAIDFLLSTVRAAQGANPSLRHTLGGISLPFCVTDRKCKKLF